MRLPQKRITTMSRVLLANRKINIPQKQGTTLSRVLLVSPFFSPGPQKQHEPQKDLYSDTSSLLRFGAKVTKRNTVLFNGLHRTSYSQPGVVDSDTFAIKLSWFLTHGILVYGRCRETWCLSVTLSRVWFLNLFFDCHNSQFLDLNSRPMWF